MPSNITSYDIFIASPGGLNAERKGFKSTIDDYNNDEAVFRNVLFKAIGWEDTFAGIGRPQGIINNELRKCDYFIIVLHDRWGTHPGENEKCATSGTEEEYKIALECVESQTMQQIVVLFKEVPPNQLSDPGKELKKVLAFRKSLEKGKQILYGTFSSTEEFNKLIRKYLAKWLRDSDSFTDPSNGNAPIAPIDTNDFSGFLPNGVEDENKRNEAQVNSKIKENIELAWKLAKEGHIAQAEVEFSKVIVNQPGAFQFLNYSEFLKSIGRFNQAVSVVEKALEIARDSNDHFNEVAALIQLGFLLRIKGDLKGAEEMFSKALEVETKLGRREGMAINYGYLGNIYLLLDDMDRAEKMIKKALEINEELGRFEGLASNYGNLGSIFFKKTTLNEAEKKYNLDEAEKMYNKALEVNLKLDRLMGIATNYGNIGSILLERGDLGGAEKMQNKSLEANQKIENFEGLAVNYAVLGEVHLKRGDMAGAAEMIRKALEINQKLGNQKIIASNAEKLGDILLRKSNFKEAEKMYRKALEIDQIYGVLMDKAPTYRNLGLALLTLGNLDEAEEMTRRALEANRMSDDQEGLAMDYGVLGEIMKTKGNLGEAENMYKRGIAIASLMGFKSIETKINEAFDEIKRKK